MNGPRIGVVGTGQWGRNLVRNFSSLGVLGALCDTDGERLSAIAREFRVSQTYRDIDGLLDDKNVDAVVIATPSATHGALARKVLSTEKPVFVEKPLCLDLGEGQELKSIVSAKQLLLMVGHLLLYHPAFVALKQFIHSGKLGELRYIYSHRLNFLEVRGDNDALWDFAPHDLSMLLSLVGELPTYVTTSGGSSVDPPIAETTLSHFSFASGLHAHVFVSWVHPHKDQRLVIVGEEGMVIFDDVLPAPNKLRFYPHAVDWQGGVPAIARDEALPIPYDNTEPLAVECTHFLDCITHDRAPLSDIDEAMKVLAVLDACQRSMESGQPVTI
jgi:UDP-2-acetamido-3-amino-2,3-dideoxy-glucuronate N-acetyltransferase